MPNFNGQDVGQISIKVVPNLDGFRAELRRELEAIEKSVRGEVHVDVEADTRGVREEIEAAARDTTAHVDVEVNRSGLDRFQRRMLREIESAMAQIEPKLHLTPDGEKLRRDLEKLTHTLKRDSHFEVDTDLGIAAGQREKLAAEVKAAKEYAEKFAGPLEFKTKTDKEQFAFQQRLDRYRAAREKELAALRERSANVSAQIEQRHAGKRHRNEMQALKEQLNESVKAFNDQEVKVKASLDELSFEKTLAEARALAQQAGVKLDVDIKDAAAEAKLAATIAKLRMEAAAAGIKIDVDIDHNRIRRAADGAITTFRKGLLKGLSRAGNMLSDDTTLIAAAVLSLGAPLVGTATAAIAGLPALLSAIAVPAAAAAFGINGIKQALIDTGIAIEDEKDGLKLGPIFDGIKASISEVFSSGLTPVFTKLLDLLPTLEAGLKPVAQAMVDTAGAITDVVTSSRGLQITENVLGNVTKLGDALAPGWAKATEAIMELADRGSNHLKGLGDWFTALMDRVKNAVDSVISSGAFDKAISGLKPILQGLANAIGNIFSTAFDWISNPANSQRFGDFIEQLGSLVKGALKVSEVIFPILERLGEYIGTLVDQFSINGKVDIEGFIGQIVTDIKNAAPWGDLLVDAGRLLGHGLLSGLASVMTSEKVLAAIPVIGAPLSWIAKSLGLQDPEKIKADLNKELNNIVSGAAGQVDPQAFAPAFSRDFAPLFDDPDATAQKIMDGLDNALGIAVPQAQQKIANAEEQIKKATQIPAGTGIDGGVGGASIPQQVQQNAEQLKQVVGSSLSGLKATATEKFGEVVDAAQEAIDQIIPKFADLPPKIVEALSSLKGLMEGVGSDAAQGLIDGMGARLADVFAAAKNLGVEAVKGARAGLESKSPSREMMRVGDDANAGFMIGLERSLDKAGLVANGVALMEGLGTGLEQGFQGVLEQTKALAGRIQEAIDSGMISTNLGGFKKQYQQQMDALQLTRQQLQIQLEGTEDKAQKKALREQLSQLSNAREMLQLQSQQLRLNDRYGEGLVDQNQLMTDMLGKMTQAGQAFGMANAQQVMSDLGISGQGAIPQLANIGLGFASQMVGQLLKGGMGGGTTIQVNSADEAFATYQRVNNQQALKHNRR